jgi:hypothetical protein
MRRFLSTGVVAASAAAVLLAAPAYAKGASISVSPSSVPAGGTVHISGSIPTNNCPAAEGATVTGESGLFPPDGFGPTATRDSSGEFAIDYAVPATTPAAGYDVGLRCGGANIGVFARLTVTAVPVGGPATGLGGSGHGSAWLTLFGVGCLALAGVALRGRRRLVRRKP